MKDYPSCPRHIDTDEVMLGLCNNKLKRLEIELSMTKGFFNRFWLKLNIKEAKKDIKRINRNILIDKIMEEMK